MFNFIKSFIGSNSYLGVDIGTTSIKMVELSKGRIQPRLLNYGILETYGHLERFNDAIQTSFLKIAERQTSEFLKMLLEKTKTKTVNAIASVPAFSAFTTTFEIPEMSEVDTAKAVPFQISQNLPVSVSEMAVEWFKIGKKEDEKGFMKQEIFVISVPKEQIIRYQNIFKLAGLKLKAIEIETFALIRSLVGNDPTATLIVDIGARSTNIAVVEQGFLRYSYQTDFAGGSLTQAIAKALNINTMRAEEIKKQKGLLAADSEYELSTLIIPLLDAIINEAKRVKDNYEKNRETKIERVILAGGGANLLGINHYFEEQINLPVVIGNSFLKIEYPPKIEPFIKELGPSFSVAVGLGIREFI